MNRRVLSWAVGILLVGVVVLSGVGMALAWGQHGNIPWNAGPGSMMGSSRHGTMMAGQSSATPQTTLATDITRVQIAGFAFSPANIQVPVGTRVTWTNLDAAPHTVTFSKTKQGSSTLQQRQTFSYTFVSSGSFTYYCAVHPYMTATVTVSP